jgi:hypothetical protein
MMDMETAEMERLRLTLEYQRAGATEEEAELLADRELAHKEKVAGRILELTKIVNRLERIRTK